MIATASYSYDMIIVGAGISGVNFAYRLQERIPNLSFAILEARDSIGGTWDLFRYPGIRSDSDLYTFSFLWNPWTGKESIAEGSLILKYIKESAAKYGIDKRVQLKHHVNSANWSSEQQTWTLEVDTDGERKTFRSRFLQFCTGYYDYEEPLQTIIPGIENFTGKVVHPQFWPQDLDYSDKDVVVIGSGATAITLLPALAKDARLVTMLQRSPSYILSQPKESGLDKLIRSTTPTSLARRLIRLKWLVLPWLFVKFCKNFPGAVKSLLRSETTKQLPSSISYDPNFKPSYNPWEQRVCFCPDGDFYQALRSGKGSVVTGHIKNVTESVIKLADGKELQPDIIVTATGLKLRLAGGMRITVDGQPIAMSEKFIWKTIMLQDLPNAFFVIGYVNASWTLGADAASKITCRLIKKMISEEAVVVIPRIPNNKVMKEMPVMDISSTYMQKAKSVIPKASDEPQWKPRSSYFTDIWEAYFGDIKTGLQFIKGAA